MPFCKYCGAMQDRDAVFCESCGKQIRSRTKPRRERSRINPAREVFILTEANYYENNLRYPGKHITPEMVAQINSLRVQIARYTSTMLAVNQFAWQHPNLMSKDEWRRVEASIAKKIWIKQYQCFSANSCLCAPKKE